MEVAHFTSALTHASRAESAQWLALASKGDLPLILPDGTVLSLAVDIAKDRNFEGITTKFSNANSSEGTPATQPSEVVTVTVALQKHIAGPNRTGMVATSSTHQPMSNLIPTGGFPFTLRCRPPKAKITRPQDEPDDNSLATRSSRYALAQLDTSKVHPDWSYDEKLAYTWTQLYVLVTMLPNEEAFNVAVGPTEQGNVDNLAQSLLDAHLAVPHPVQDAVGGLSMLIVLRSTFWQNATPFHRPPWLVASRTDAASLAAPIYLPAPELYTLTRNIYHPQRPRKPTPADGPLYTRYVLELGETLTFEPVSYRDDAFVELFTKWHADERVNDGWRQRASLDTQRKYLKTLEESPDVMPLVAKWNGEPFGYIEAYWAKESNIGTYYDAQDYDRGFHVLVGESRFRGPHRVRSWMGSAFHMLFSLDPRTQRVVLEPRASNAKMINYTTMCGAHVEKLLDLPHKRAALVVCPREGFFQLCPLGPLKVQG